MPYENIQPPFTLVFREMSKAELKAYFEWVMAQIEIRVPLLEAAVRETPGWENWTADYREDSLGPLNRWLTAQVETRLMTREETAEIERTLTFPITLPTRDLTVRTLSIAYDVGLYVGELTRRAWPEAKWTTQVKRIRDVNYGQPVLTGFRSIPFNPIHVANILARKIGDGQDVGEGLVDIYAHWTSEARAAMKKKS